MTVIWCVRLLCVRLKMGNKRQKSSLNPSIENSIVSPYEQENPRVSPSDQYSMQVSGWDISSHLLFLCQDEDLIRLTINYLDESCCRESLFPAIDTHLHRDNDVVLTSNSTDVWFAMLSPLALPVSGSTRWVFMAQTALAGRSNARDQVILVSAMDPLIFGEQITVQRRSVTCNVHSLQHIDNWKLRYPSSSSSSRLRRGQHLSRENAFWQQLRIALCLLEFSTKKKI